MSSGDLGAPRSPKLIHYPGSERGPHMLHVALRVRTGCLQLHGSPDQERRAAGILEYSTVL